jgi:DNA-binding FrmR family transcriptional regulator
MRKRRALIALVLAMFLLPVMPSIMADTLPTVATDQQYYHPGEVVKVTGTATVAGPVTLQFKVGGETIDTATAEAASDGKYQYSYNLPANPERGTWTVKVEDSATPTHKMAETTFIVLNAATEEIAGKLLVIAEEAKTYAEGSLGTQPPEAAQENFDAGVKALEDAQALFDGGKYAASIEASLRAQKHFGNALKILARDHPEEDHEDDELRLENQIERAQRKLDSLVKVHNNVKKGLSAEASSNINTELTAAQIDLDAAKAALSAGQLTNAGNSLSDAEEHMETVKGLLQDYVNEKREDQILNFVDKAIERVDKLKAAVEKLRERIGSEAADDLLSRLDAIRVELVELRTLVEDGATVEDINIQVRAIQELLENIHDASLREALKEMDSMQAWIQIMKETRSAMVKKGLKTGDVDDRIKGGEDALGRTISELAAGRKTDGRFSEIIKGFKENYMHHGG